MTAKPDRAIAFHGNPPGVIEDDPFHTNLGNLLTLGAFIKTVRHNEETARTEFQTDADGARRIAEMADATLNALHAAISDIGILLAITEPKEIPDDTLRSLGWTVTGLAELAGDIKEALLTAEDQVNRTRGERI